MSGALIGAVVGVVVGIALSVYVARLDAARRASGERSRFEYKSSLVIVPVLLAVIGGLVGAAIAH